MPGIDDSEVRVGATGNLYMGAVGATVPAGLGTLSAPTWVDLGALSEEGPKVTPTRDVSPIMPWQGLFPIRQTVTGASFVLGFTLIQRNAATLRLAFGGGTLTEAPADSGIFTFTPPDPEDIDEHAFILEVRDGTVTDRWVLDRGMATLDGDVAFSKDAAVAFPLSVTALAVNGALPWRLISNDPALEA